MNDTIAYVKILAQDLAGCEPDCALLAILFDLTVPVNYDGFEYLKASVIIQHANPTLDLVNDIYEMLAKQYGVSTDMIAAAIRSAIKVAWSRADTEKWYRYLPTVPTDKGTAPTNAEVIAGLARIIELWQGCANAYLRQQSKEVASVGRE